MAADYCPKIRPMLWTSRSGMRWVDMDNQFFNFDLLDTYDWLRPDDTAAEAVPL